MNSRQAIALLISLALIALCALFPPRKYAGTTISVGGATIASRCFLFHPAIHQKRTRTKTYRIAIDVERLMAECLLIGALTGIAVILLRRSNSKSA